MYSRGGQLMCDRILKVVSTNTKTVLYQSENFIQPIVEIKPSTQDGYTHSVYIDGQLYSNHKTERQAILLKNKMS